LHLLHLPCRVCAFVMKIPQKQLRAPSTLQEEQVIAIFSAKFGAHPRDSTSAWLAKRVGQDLPCAPRTTRAQNGRETQTGPGSSPNVPQLLTSSRAHTTSCRVEGHVKKLFFAGTLGSQSTETVCEQTATSGPRVPCRSHVYSTRRLQQDNFNLPFVVYYSWMNIDKYEGDDRKL
jgi:hypothetical protein